MIVSSTVMLIGFIVIGNHMPSSSTEPTFSYASLFNLGIDKSIQYAIFPVIFFALILRAPLFPFHTWMAKAIKHGPIVTMSVLLIGINIAVYGLVRLAPLFADALNELSMLVTLFCLASVIYGSLIALVQDNLNKILVYGTVAHLGIIVISLFPLSTYGLYASILGSLGLSITCVGLFFISDFVKSRSKQGESSGEHYYLYRSSPLLTASFIALALGNIGFPGTISFNAEHNMIMAGINNNWLMLLTVFIGVLLSASYFLMYFKRTLLDSRTVDFDGNNKFKDLQPREALIALVFVALVFSNGLFEPYIEYLDSSLEAVSSHLEYATTHNE
jgi:NADH-quinone oxidoreductase subunit M